MLLTSNQECLIITYIEYVLGYASIISQGKWKILIKLFRKYNITLLIYQEIRINFIEETLNLHFLWTIVKHSKVGQ